MITLDVNPAERRSILHQQLTRCFPSWGGPDATRWYLDREVDGERPDVVTLSKEGRCVAGILIHYRQLEEHPQRSQLRLCGILGSTWTIPEMRGQRLYSRLVREVDAVARERGASRLLSFSRTDNHSGATLVRAGARERAAEYWCFDAASGDGPEARLEWREEARSTDVESELWVASERASAGRARLRYLSRASFCSQYLDRPGRVGIVRGGERGESWGVIEDGGGVDRLLLLAPGGGDREEPLLASLRARSLARGRALFCFRPPRAPALPALASLARRTPCRFTVKVIVGPDVDPPVTWAIHNGDRM